MGVVMKSAFVRGMRVVLFAVIAMALCIAAGPAVAQGPPIFDVQEIGPGTIPADLNNRGEVVGGARGPVPGGYGFTAFYWFDGVLVDLGANWENASSALSVNNSGVILGTVEGVGDELDRLFEIDAEGNISYPAPFDPAVDVRAKAINDEGQIVGTHSSTSIPFFWDRTTVYDLVPSWAVQSFFGGLNNLGQVAGSSREDGCGNSGFLWQMNFFTEVGSCNDRIAANDINDTSQIVGSMFFAGENQKHAFVYEDSQFTDLGVLDGQQASVARSINNQGWIVGDSSSSMPPSGSAFIYIDGVMYDLNDYVSTESWRLTRALKINDRGQILMLANLTTSFGSTYLLLTPSGIDSIPGLIELIESYELHHGIEHSLLVKLEHANEAVADGNLKRACHRLQAFINQVNAQTGKKITETQAEEILEAVDTIRAALPCP